MWSFTEARSTLSKGENWKTSRPHQSMSFEECLTGDGRVSRKQKRIQKEAAPACVWEPSRWTIQNTAGSNGLGAALAARGTITFPRSPGRVTVRWPWLDGWLKFLVAYLRVWLSVSGSYSLDMCLIRRIRPTNFHAYCFDLLSATVDDRLRRPARQKCSIPVTRVLSFPGY